MLEREYEFYQKNKKFLRSKYLGKHIVISSDKVLGSYDSDEEAYAETLKTLELGEFMIKLVTPTDEEAVQRFSSLVYV